MEYNTRKKKLILPEYGRNVQKLIEKAIEIEDDDERSSFVQNIIDMMGRMHPGLRDLKDFKHKLWDHLLIMANFNPKIESPFKAPINHTFEKSPEKVPYIKQRIKYPHYGNTVTRLISYASTIEDKEEKNTLIGLIANHMKKLYVVWNKANIDDRHIFKDIYEISNGKIDVPDEFVLSNVKDLTQKKQKVKKKPEKFRRK